MGDLALGWKRGASIARLPAELLEASCSQCSYMLEYARACRKPSLVDLAIYISEIGSDSWLIDCRKECQ